MTAIEFAKKHLPQYKTLGDEIIAMYCPFCNGGTHKDKYTFAINSEKGIYNCKRGKCGVTGTLFRLLKEFGEIEHELQQYKKPQTQLKPATKQSVAYLCSRGISIETQRKYKIATDASGNIIFPFFDENRNFVFSKFRPAREIKAGEQKCWREKGTKPILFGMNICVVDKPLVICEGEIDCLSIAEAGVPNAVSVPSGTNDFSWLDCCWEWIEQYKKIIIWADNDIAGKEMQKKLIAKLGEWRCYIVSCMYKDANEALQKKGKEYVAECVRNATEVQISGLLRVSDVQEFDYSNAETVRSGFKYLDEATNGFMMGLVSVWTGRNGAGKSTLICQTLIEAIEQGFGVCAFSGELPASLFRYWAELQIVGVNNISKKYSETKCKEVQYVDNATSTLIRQWYRDKFFLYDSLQQGNKDEDILKVFEYAARRHDCKIFLVDNLMMTRFTDDDTDFYRRQGYFVGKVVELAHKFNVHVHVVAHPAKRIGDLKRGDTRGSGEIEDRADNVFCVSRLTEEEKQDHSNPLNGCDTSIEIWKNRFFGEMPEIGLNFDSVSKRFYNTIDDLQKSYSWEYLRDCPF